MLVAVLIEYGNESISIDLQQHGSGTVIDADTYYG